MPKKKIVPLQPSRPGPPVFQRALSPDKLLLCTRYMELWKAQTPINDIAATLEISRSTAFNWNQNLINYGSIQRPPRRPLGRRRAITLADEKALFMELQTTGWLSQDEMIRWLAEERGAVISQPAISKMLMRNKWTRRSITLMSNNRIDRDVG